MIRFSFLCMSPRWHPRAHTATRPCILRSGLQMWNPWVDAGRGNRSRCRRCYVADAIFPAPGLSLPSCCSLIIGKRGPVQARRRVPKLQGSGEASRGTTSAPSSAPAATSAWLSLTVPCPGPLGCRPPARPLVLFSAGDKAWTSGPSTP